MFYFCSFYPALRSQVFTCPLFSAAHTYTQKHTHTHTQLPILCHTHSHRAAVTHPDISASHLSHTHLFPVETESFLHMNSGHVRCILTWGNSPFVLAEMWPLSRTRRSYNVAVTVKSTPQISKQS